MATTIHGMMPANVPNQKDSQLGLPGVSYFSMSSPKRIMLALTPKIASSAAMSLTPVIMLMSTIMRLELKKYSIQRP